MITLCVLLVGLGALALGQIIVDLVKAELMGWLDLTPRGILRLAAMQLDTAQRETLYREEWLPELLFILRNAEGRPITRLVRGVGFALGLVLAARRIARLRAPSPAPVATLWRRDAYPVVYIVDHKPTGNRDAIPDGRLTLRVPGFREARTRRFILRHARRMWPDADPSDLTATSFRSREDGVGLTWGPVRLRP